MQGNGHSRLDAADRFMVQVGHALVWPKPKDADDHLIRASALIAEMAPQNVTEAMLATQMIAANARCGEADAQYTSSGD